MSTAYFLFLIIFVCFIISVLFRLIASYNRILIGATSPIIQAQPFTNDNYRQAFKKMICGYIEQIENIKNCSRYNVRDKFFKYVFIPKGYANYKLIATIIPIAFGNLTEIQRDEFARNKESVKKIESILEKLFWPVMGRDLFKVVHNLANYYRTHRRVEIMEFNPRSFFISDEFRIIFSQCTIALKQRDIFNVFSILTRFRNAKEKNFSDIEIILCAKAISLISSFIQGNEYPADQKTIEERLKEMEKIFAKIEELINKNNPEKILKYVA
ncbi:MAG: hypothetical protein HYV24_09390 [Deltaproteobacteria bacterium]|nr:hypothetical protein [Deltaproteobacteria bacterium]